MLELHLVSTAADTLIVTALASTIFFAVPTDQARSRVATSLVVTMVPFVLLAPVIGPLLDRVRHGRRYALAVTMVVRAFLAWVMAGAVGGAGSTEAKFSLYPAAFGFLLCQKAYLVSRAAALPRVLPRGIGLVAANSRISMFSLAAMGLAAPLGAGLTTWLGASATLRLAFVVFAAGTALALLLPAAVDVAVGGQPTSGAARAREAVRPSRWRTGPRIVLALRGNTALRAFTGFLTLFLAFRLRTEPLTGLSDTVAVALVIALAAVGGAIGTALGSLLRRARPEGLVVLVMVLTTAAAGWAAVDYGIWPVLTVCLIAGLSQALGKLCLDALIQREAPEDRRTSVFARSETLLQLAWVLGGAAGLVLPLSGAWGMSLAASALVVATALIAVSSRSPAIRAPATGDRPGRPGG
jgi:predicted MFS family arabinose efflux permease